MVHTFGKIWEERGLINTQGKGLVHEKLILEVLKALRGPLKIAIVHVKGHQRGLTPTVRGNNLADAEAKRAALLVVQTLREEPEKLRLNKTFTLQEMEKFKQNWSKKRW